MDEDDQVEGVVPTEIDRDEMRRLVAGAAQLIEVLPSKGYDEEHLPGAINIPLQKLNHETTAQLERDQPVIVYCADYQ